MYNSKKLFKKQVKNIFFIGIFVSNLQNEKERKKYFFCR